MNGSPIQPFKTTVNLKDLDIFLRSQAWEHVWLNHEPTRDRDSSSSVPRFSSPCRKENWACRQWKSWSVLQTGHRLADGRTKTLPIPLETICLWSLHVSHIYLCIYPNSSNWSSLVWNTSKNGESTTLSLFPMLIVFIIVCLASFYIWFQPQALLFVVPFPAKLKCLLIPVNNSVW